MPDPVVLLLTLESGGLVTLVQSPHALCFICRAANAFMLVVPNDQGEFASIASIYCRICLDIVFDNPEKGTRLTALTEH